MGLKVNREFLYNNLLPNLLNWMLVALMFVTSKVFDLFFPPFERRFSLNDVSISYPHQKIETVNNLWLWLSSLLFPAIIIALLNLPKREFRKIHTALLCLCFSTALAYLVTHFTKNLAGRPRPDFLYRCLPKSNTIQIGRLYELATSEICSTKDLTLLRSGRQSFFSGHTSTAFSGLGYLSLYLASFFGLWKRPGNVYKCWVSVIPLLIALFIGFSRVIDYRHHWEDVLVGMIVGYACAYFCFKQSFLFDYKVLRHTLHESDQGNYATESFFETP